MSSPKQKIGIPLNCKCVVDLIQAAKILQAAKPDSISFQADISTINTNLLSLKNMKKAFLDINRMIDQFDSDYLKNAF